MGNRRIPLQAASSDWFATLIDSVAHTLDQASFEKWKVSPEEWRTRLAQPFYARIRESLQIEPHPDSAVTARIARMMAYRATEIRWGTDKAHQLGLANDEEIRAAVGAFAAYETTLRRP